MLVATICALLFAVASPSSPPMTISGIVARHVAALGGIVRIHAVHSFVKRGWYHEGDFRIDTYTAQMRPFYRVIGDPVVHRLDQIHEGYDGSAWEYYPDPGVVVRTVRDAARATRNSAMFDDPLVEPTLHLTTLTLGDDATFEGHPVYTVHVTLVDGFKEDLLVDRDTFMIDGRWQVVPMHAFGARLKTYDVYDDYRPEGGIMMYHRDSEVDSATGRVLDDGGINSVVINPKLDLSFFSPPQWSLTPLQTMLERIYDEREDAGAVLTTYHQFFPLVEHDAKMGDAVDFIGYQCLKMGHTETAVALLKQNVADHPESAQAHFGLGRALQTSGDVTEAAVEYRKALTIDPSLSRAKAALDALGQTSH
ncbi:MAG TPA: tetratricopeptide repeat protein [Candidatus Eremiobacteraceae bacterium]|nr:tetratricopeptide repeat protein [Candidatus Eremiobacteraceae bacterium]